MTDASMDADTEFQPITELSKTQRRVLGVLIEKAFTTPEYYPMTLKAVTAGCNQKSNRDPVTSYSEEAVFDVLDELRQLGLVAVVHTESGRTERYRHYMRKRFPFTEPQLAIVTELLLRGRQQLGELRSRASRMVSIDSQEQLRDELQGLREMKFLQANGSLDRRGVEVDHTFYRSNEGQTLADMRDDGQPRVCRDRIDAVTAPTGPAGLPVNQGTTAVTPGPSSLSGASPAVPASNADALSRRLAIAESIVEQLTGENRQLHDDVDALREDMRQLSVQFEQLRRDLGG